MELLKQKYNRIKYLEFLDEKFTFQEFLSPIDKGKDNETVKTFKQLGVVTTADDKELLIFEIHIKDQKLAKNRVALRNLVAKEIVAEEGALAVYVDDENNQWRFSFIAIEYVLDDDGIKKEQTASKRFTYLLGKNAQTKTAESRFKTLGKESTLGDLKVAFSVESLNKEFYDKLYQWYDKAQHKVTFPNDEQAENHTQTSLIRLLTRLLFVWFLKEKELINKDLFVKEKLEVLINYQKDSSFYKAILQNLFFATLNRQIITESKNNRSFRRTTNGKANNTNYLATNIYRYQDYFKEEDEVKIIKLFAQTPFLNGGLFECLDREANDDEKSAYDKDKNIRPVKSAIRIDGFSDNNKNQLNFTNDLFFNEDEQDLGLIDLLSQYQFTVEESTPLDVEVALDPELLGKVFENLLASYNPETGDQARKATGSFYTPREIVSYMVDESLKQHFKTHTNLKDKINDLFIESIESKNSLNKEETKKVVKVIDSLKILDPAVGSGAYPMGILQRLVFILDKIDPENKYFKQQQLDKAELMEEASKKATIEAIEQVFSEQNQHNAYGKKLMLIENCIYGVDIQPIAIQICKLRFFISLTIEQQPNNDEQNNYGIKALPNLETKFIVANTLLPLGEIEVGVQQTFGMFDKDITELQKSLAKIRHNYFSAKTLKTKQKYRDRDKNTRQDMLETLAQSGITPCVAESMQKVVNWDLYNQNSISDWFDPEWMFGIKEGFDIVIGNPPYINIEKISDNVKKHLFARYNTCRGRTDVYIAFLEFTLKILNTDGIVSFIIPHSFVNQNYGTELRQFILNNYFVKEIVDTSDYFIFDNATVKNIIISIVKSKDAGRKTRIRIAKSPKSFKNHTYQQNFLEQKRFSLLKNTRFDTRFSEKFIFLRDKIWQNSLPFMDICFVAYGARLNHRSKKIRKSYYVYQKHNSNFKPFLEGKDIERYKLKQSGWLNYVPSEHYNPMFSELFESNKIMFINVVSDRLRFAFDKEGFYNSHTVINCVRYDLIKEAKHVSVKRSLKEIDLSTVKNYHYYYLISILNSNLINWYFLKFLSEGLHFYPNDAKNIPIKKISAKTQKPFIQLVDKILKAKQDGKDTNDFETQIDKMVYRLYSLTVDEIKIIEGKK